MPNNSNLQTFASNDISPEPKPPIFDINHDIETQSIYGFDQIMYRPPSHSSRLDQASIARNFSKRTLCSISQYVELDFETYSMAEHQLATRKPLRWFESGSVGSVHLDSSFDIFNETANAPNRNRRRRSSVSKPFWNAVVYTEENESSSRVTVPEKFSSMEGIEQVATPATSTEGTDSGNNRDGCCCTIFKWLVRFFDLDLLRDKIYLNIMIGMAISIFAEINFAILTPFILSDLQFDSDAIANILLVMAIADLISRFCSPFLADRFDVSIRMNHLISLIVLVVTRMGKAKLSCFNNGNRFLFSLTFSIFKQ